MSLAALLLAATACSFDSDEPDSATDPNPPAADGFEIPSPAIVMDVDRPELCTGPIAESYPPQCDGPAIRDWRWRDFGVDDYDKVGKIRWGEFVIDGYLDGDEFVVTSAEPAG